MILINGAHIFQQIFQVGFNFDRGSFEEIDIHMLITLRPSRLDRTGQKLSNKLIGKSIGFIDPSTLPRYH